MLYGRGAGDMPTASAVVSDVVYAAGREKHHYTTFYNEDNVSDELSFENNWECEFLSASSCLTGRACLPRLRACSVNTA